MKSEDYPAIYAIKYLKKCDFPMNSAISKSGTIEAAMEYLRNKINKKEKTGGMIQVEGKAYPRRTVLFAVSVIIIAAAKNHVLMQRFALNESIFEEKDLLYDPEILGKLINHTVSDDGIYEISVADYLKRSIVINEPRWKLVNRSVNSGQVSLSRNELVRLLRSDITQMIVKSIQSVKLDDHTIKILEPHITKASALVPVRNMPKPGSGGLPPCIMHAIAYLKDGGNLNHTGRFMLASYFLKAGKSPEEITQYFENAPDFARQVTITQIRQIQKTQYMPQSCNRLEQAGLCHKTLRCGTIKNPIQYR